MRTTITSMTDMDIPTITDSQLVRLMVWLSPSFPTGAFAYSHGLEWAVEKRLVHDRASLIDWMKDVITNGSGWTDCVLLRLAWRCDDDAGLQEVADLAAALAPSRERHEEMTAQGNAFARAIGTWGVVPGIIVSDDRALWPLPVVMGATFRIAGIGEDHATLLALHGFVANLISAAVRLVPLGQTDGLRALAALEEQVISTSAESARADAEDLGGFSLNADLAALHHETQQTRLFRT